MLHGIFRGVDTQTSTRMMTGDRPLGNYHIESQFRMGGFRSHRATPSVILRFHRTFHEMKHPAIGGSPKGGYGNPRKIGMELDGILLVLLVLPVGAMPLCWAVVL